MTNSERPFNYSWTRANTNTPPQSPTKRSPKPSRDIFTMPCSKRRNGRKEAKARDGRVLHLSSERSPVLNADRAKIAVYAYAPVRDPSWGPALDDGFDRI